MISSADRAAKSALSSARLALLHASGMGSPRSSASMPSRMTRKPLPPASTTPAFFSTGFMSMVSARALVALVRWRPPARPPGAVLPAAASAARCGGQTGDGEDGALGGLHHRLVGGGHALLQGGGQSRGPSQSPCP